MASKLRQKIRAELEAPAEKRQLGTGWLAGTCGLAAALAGLAFVITLKFPQLLSMPDLKLVTATSWFRLVTYALLALGFFLATINLVLRPIKTLGITTLAVVLSATLLGGLYHGAPELDAGGYYLGLDFFILNLIFLGFIFIPLEKFLAHREGQGVFRVEWREDLFYYLVSSMLVQVLAFLTLAPSRIILANWNLIGLRDLVASQPIWLQVIEIMFLTDFAQYWLHRAFHQVPALWRFHAVHHSAQTMDWIAGARMHFLEVIILRSVTATPMLVVGFSEAAVQAYILIVYVYSSILHANIRVEPKWLTPILATPRFHHWHHGIEREAIDVNFAIHFPIFDRLFGTHHMPEGKWPSGYGIGGHPVPKGYWQQFLYPFKRES
jgi:sterol desaturase/sphingolipid hydroxylase (fatty acid hydroxylase superfamily)